MSCGCEFEVDDSGDLIIEKDFKNLRVECQATWDLIGSGDTEGCFQIESYLGQKISKQLKPSNMSELAALVAIMRPGCLEAKMEDGLSVTEHFIRRKHGREEVSYLHPSLEKILESTYGLLVFQEQSIRIGQDIAGMDEATSDKYLRKAVGKKDAELLSQCRQLFLEGCQEQGIVPEATAEQIFKWIASSARYGFNKCLAPDTKVNKSDGSIVSLSDLVIGDHILCPGSDYHKDEYIEITNIIDQGSQQLYEVELSNGSKIRCSMNHKFLASNGNIETLEFIINNDLEIMVIDGGNNR